MKARDFILGSLESLKLKLCYRLYFELDRQGHMRSQRSNSEVRKGQKEANQLNIWNSPRDMIFALQTGMIPTTIIEYENLISEVIRGYWRSKQVKKR